MDLTTHPYRSVLYIPGSKERALEKAQGLPTDAIIFDLEDAVSPDAKAEARETLAAALKAGGFGKRAKIVRINALTTEWGNEDVRVLKDAGADIFLLPKVNTPTDVDALADLLGPQTPIWVMMETPVSVFNAREIAAHAQVKGLVAGTNDLTKDLGCRTRVDRLPLMTSLQMIVMAARAARGVVAIDGVYNRFRDGDGLKAECEQGRDLGFDGKTLIHPAQIDVTNTAFAPTQSEIELAERQIAAFEESHASGQGVAVVDGQIVENLHVVAAQRTLGQIGGDSGTGSGVNGDGISYSRSGALVCRAFFQARAAGYARQHGQRRERRGRVGHSGRSGADGRGLSAGGVHQPVVSARVDRASEQPADAGGGLRLRNERHQGPVARQDAASAVGGGEDLGGGASCW